MPLCFLTISIAVPSTSFRCLRRSPSCYVCWFVLKEHVYQFQLVNTGKVQYMSSVCVHLSLSILSNYCLVNFVFSCATAFRIEIARYDYGVSVVDVSDNAIKFGINFFLWFNDFLLLFSVGAYTLKMSTFKSLLTFILTLQILSYIGSNSAFTSDDRMMPTPFSGLFLLPEK